MDLQQIADQAIALGHQGFDTVNSLQGIVIAVIAAAVMRRYSHIIGMSLLATIAHEIVTIARGAVGGGSVTLPDITNPDVLKLIAVRFVGYLVVISLIYLVRRVVMRS
tara:strand:- start:5082 stop:5405 length:324 start_codon:yes stop_codon:yes gene_type:complete